MYSNIPSLASSLSSVGPIVERQAASLPFASATALGWRPSRIGEDLKSPQNWPSAPVSDSLNSATNFVSNDFNGLRVAKFRRKYRKQLKTAYLNFIF